MKTLVCRHCGCSLVRLGITEAKAVAYHHEGKKHFFCCQGCVDLFAKDPEKSLQETGDVFVCPTCLGEKPLERSIPFEWAGHELRFCRCPYCTEEFQNDPDHYLARLKGKVPVESVLRHC